MTTLPYLSSIKLSGTDAGQFLHDQLSADILVIEPGQSRLACYCEPKGRVLALMRVGRHQQDYFVVLSKELATTIMQRLQLYVFRSEVSMQALNVQVVLPNTSNAGDKPGDAQGSVVLPLTDFNEEAVNFQLLASGAETAGSSPGLTSDWRFSELQHGVSWLGTESSGKFLPQMLGFDRIGALNFKKGCYPGQEIIARSHYLGKIKRHPRILLSPQNICVKPMDKIEIHTAGERFDAVVVDSAHRGDGDTCLLAVARMEPQLAATGLSCNGSRFNCHDKTPAQG